jgi:transposase
MEILYERCAGLDVHKNVVVACVRIGSGASGRHEHQRFATTTAGLLDLKEWLASLDCSHAVMEATGVYWKPVWHVLEDGVELVLANAHHVKNVPGRKSDMNDATWLADLLAHGLIRGSFVPPRPVRELRDLTRTRRQLVKQRVQHTQRIQKVLEDANLKLSSVLSDTVGQSGRKILEALVAGESNPLHLAALANERVAATDAELVAALTGRPTEHHRFLIKLHLDQIDTVNASIATLDAQIERCLAPFRWAVDQLDAIPGVSQVAAVAIVAEIGIDMSRFPTASNLVSWAGLCPRLDESAGKKRDTRTRHGDPWLKSLLVQCALCAGRKKDSYYRSLYGRIKGRRGAKKAAVAVAASMLTAAYHIIKSGTVYQDLEASYLDPRDRKIIARRLVSRLSALGFTVEVKDTAA